MAEPYLLSTETPLLLQVVSDYKRFEPFSEHARPHPASPIGYKYKQFEWGKEPARHLLSRIGRANEEDGKPWSVGFGFTTGVTPDSVINQITAERKLESLVLDMDNALRSIFAWYSAVSFVTRTVLVNLALDVGLKGLLGFKNTLAVIQSKQYPQAAQDLKQSLWYKQNPRMAKELVERLRTQCIEPQNKAPEAIR